MPQILKEQTGNEQHAPSPENFFNTANAYQRTAALKGAVDLDLFTAVGEGATTAADLAVRCKANERGIRILADYLVVIGFLRKDNGRYGLTADAAAFLDRRSPVYLGGALGFLNSPMLMNQFSDLAGVVRKGGTLADQGGTVAPDHPIWVDFARSMQTLNGLMAEALARGVLDGSRKPMKVLDIAGGHGLFGIAFAEQNPNATVTIQEWAGVAAVARENAAKAGVGDRFNVLPGSCFDVDFGQGWDVILLTNILHHFDAPTIETLLKKVHAALAPDGRAVTLEFVPNPDRVSPPIPAAFSLIMLASTAAGDAYTAAEYQKMFGAAGFTRNDILSLPKSPQNLIVSYR